MGGILILGFGVILLEEAPPIEVPDMLIPDYPGDDPTTPPDDDYKWKGKPPEGGDKGAWVNDKTGEQWHPDLNHPLPKGPHWDYKDSSGTRWRIFPDNTFEQNSGDG